MGIFETSDSNRERILKQKKKTKNLPAKLANQLIEKYSQRKQIIPSNQTSFAEEMKSHLTEKWHKTKR